VSRHADEANDLSTSVAAPPDANRSNRPLIRRLGAAGLTLAFLLLVARFLPSGVRPPVEETRETHLMRQRVVIFLIDTVDNFDTHGTHVHSVLRQHCPRCEVHTLNLHGDLALLSVIHALRQVHTQSQADDRSITTLVNLSLGTYTYDQDLYTAVRTLEASGHVLIAAAGNDNTDRPFYPAAFREVLGVCSSARHTKLKAAYSNFGAWVSLCAPGLQYVSRPLQRGEIASGTSLAAPMVAGVLGQLLLEAPCAPPRAGVRALLRTADPVGESTTALGAGVLNPVAASHYIRSLYPCASPEALPQQLRRRAKRLFTEAGITLGVIVYFLVSIFTVPFLLALAIEHLQRHAARRRQHTFQRAYAQSATCRQQQLLRLREHFLSTRKMPRRDRIELFALLSALHHYGEPCWWCDRPAVPQPISRSPSRTVMACRRCGMATPLAPPPALHEQQEV
jgi:Subtilase family